MSVLMYKIFVHSVNIDQTNLDAPRGGQVGKRILCKNITKQVANCGLQHADGAKERQRFCGAKGSKTNHKIGVQILAPWHVLF